jgi:cytochrome P450
MADVDRFNADCIRRYGNTFTMRLPRFGEHVVTLELDSLREAFAEDSRVVQAGQGNRLLAPLLGARSLFLVDGEEHLMHRKMLLPAFHRERLAQQETIMREVAEEIVASWPSSGELRMLGEMRRFTLEVILRTVFGVSDPAGRARLGARIRHMVDLALSRTGTLVGSLADLGAPRLWPPYRRALRDLDGEIEAVVAARRGEAGVSERADVLSWLVSARDAEDRPLATDQIRDHLVSLVVAGHETTATALAWSFERLARNPGDLERLADEGRGGAEHAYADAIVKETLRLRPPVPYVIRELSRSWSLGEYRLPAGTRLVLSLSLTHRRPDLYPAPDDFRPGRFLDGASAPYSWIPFGGGVRRCIGASFASLEMRILLHATAKRCRVAAVDPEPEPAQRRAILFQPADDGLVRLERAA